MPDQPVGNLLIDFPGHEQLTNYRRELNISKAIASVSYEVNGTHFRQEVIASLTEKVIILRLMASKPGQISFKAYLNRPQRQWKTGLLNGSLSLRGMSGSADKKTGRVAFAA